MGLRGHRGEREDGEWVGRREEEEHNWFFQALGCSHNSSASASPNGD